MQEWKEKLEVEKKKKPTENERKNKYWERQTESFSSYAILSIGDVSSIDLNKKIREMFQIVNTSFGLR